MDLVRELKDVRFELSLRGYDCEAVDAFLARLRADVTTIQGENETASARIAELEETVANGGGTSETEGTLRRTLILAQRLADETEAEAKEAAAEMTAAAAAEAAQVRSKAEAESSSMRLSGEQELADARSEAAAIRETTGEEAARARSEARDSVEQLLSDAERQGMERVAVLEQTAQEETATMREGIRDEVAQLEGVRSHLLADISALETHLEQQRVRVRTAVEALRVGMSGSIDDLERVAEDDDLLATQPAPEVSTASEGDVSLAPTIEIVEATAAHAPPAPTVDEIEAQIEIAQIDDVDEAVVDVDVDVVDVVDEPVVDLVDDTVEIVEDFEDFEEFEPGPMDDETVVADDAATDDAAMAAHAVVQDTPSNAEHVFGDGPSTEPIPVVELDDEAGWTDHSFVEGSGEPTVAFAGAADLAEADLIELDDEPSALFGTEVADDAFATEVEAEEFTSGETDAASDVPVDSDEATQSGPSFVDRFGELLDALPVNNDL